MSSLLWKYEYLDTRTFFTELSWVYESRHTPLLGLVHIICKQEYMTVVLQAEGLDESCVMLIGPLGLGLTGRSLAYTNSSETDRTHCCQISCLHLVLEKTQYIDTFGEIENAKFFLLMVLEMEKIHFHVRFFLSLRIYVCLPD